MATPTGGLTTTLSPDAASTAIDTVAWERFEERQLPDYLTAQDDLFFNQLAMTGITHIWDEYSGVPNPEETGEQEEVKTVDVFIGNQQSQRVKFFKNDYPISVELFKTDKVGLRDELGMSIGLAFRRRQDYVAVIDCYGDAFDGNNFTVGSDGNSLANNTHTTLRGDNVDNLETGVMGPDNLDTLVQSLEGQLGQHGEHGGHAFAGILVPRNIYKKTKEVMDSTLLADTANNNRNLFDTVYGQVSIKQSPLLASAFNPGTNANTAYHIIGQNHFIQRRILSGFELSLVTPEFTATDSYIKRARIGEVVYPETWSAYAASTGAV